MKHRLLLLFRIVLLRFSWLTASFSLFVNRLRVQCNLMQPITFVVPVISLKYLTDAVFIIDLVPEVTCRKQRWKTKKSRRLRVWLIMFQVLLFSGYKELPILVWPPAPTENTAKRVSTTVTSLSNQSLLQSILYQYILYIYTIFFVLFQSDIFILGNLPFIANSCTVGFVRKAPALWWSFQRIQALTRLMLGPLNPHPQQKTTTYM